MTCHRAISLLKARKKMKLQLDANFNSKTCFVRETSTDFLFLFQPNSIFVGCNHDIVKTMKFYVINKPFITK
jgi:hypothetical protein